MLCLVAERPGSVQRIDQQHRFYSFDGSGTLNAQIFFRESNLFLPYNTERERERGRERERSVSYQVGHNTSLAQVSHAFGRKVPAGRMLMDFCHAQLVSKVPASGFSVVETTRLVCSMPHKSVRNMCLPQV